jgi:hypothetical protein
MKELIPKPVGVERLDKIYSCMECKAVFLFKSDVLDHQEMFGHSKMYEAPFE